MTLQGAHAPTDACDGCRVLFRWGGAEAEGVDRWEHRRGFEVVWRRRVADPFVRWRTRKVARGQALVEFALVVPVMCFMFLGFAEVGLLLSQREAWTRQAASVADTLAASPDTTARGALTAIAGQGCDGVAVSAAWASVAPGVEGVTVDLSCAYHPMLSPFFDGLRVTTEAQAVTR